MFTGIVTDIGTIASIDQKGDWTIVIEAPQTVQGLEIGTSVACNGVCLTVVERTDRAFTVNVSNETLEKTTARWWRPKSLINLERALRLGDELGGHLVSGHVDGLVRVAGRREERDSIRLQFEVPGELSPYLAPKGSVALDGISLTVNEVEGNIFGVNVIPHTQAATTIAEKKPGDLLNMEIDLIARYVGRMLQARGMMG